MLPSAVKWSFSKSFFHPDLNQSPARTVAYEQEALHLPFTVRAPFGSDSLLNGCFALIFSSVPFLLLRWKL